MQPPPSNLFFYYEPLSKELNRIDRYRTPKQRVRVSEAHSPHHPIFPSSMPPPIPTQEADNVLVTFLMLRVFMGGNDRLLAVGSQACLPLENAIKNENNLAQRSLYGSKTY
ncbi:hypothetical protein EVAR_74981_1 [Eumeta japonica]|uniref:Uncharacterized protein n=1 Tax=Eumeta variegata TaxID=151549 RepID=A0A4C1VAF1_EUMVA|nr:hypothetical protein EVAR_74981_1 [Eumeta japonica]